MARRALHRNLPAHIFRILPPPAPQDRKSRDRGGPVALFGLFKEPLLNIALRNLIR